jgi:anti-sigma factor RsiW
MIADPEHDRVVDLLGAYALDAVEPDENALVEEHLARCPRCSAELDELRQVAADLAVADGLASHQPPADMWERIASGISDRGASHPPRSATIVDLRDRPRRGPGGRWSGRRRAWMVGVVGAGAAAAIAGLAIGLVQAQGQVQQLQATLTGHGARAAVQAALASPGHRVVELRSGSGTQLAEVVVQRNGMGVVVRSTMSRLPSTETYELWASIDGRPIALGLLGRRPASGSAFSLGTAVTSARELMVTIEPAGGVPTPDRSPIATAPLSVS